MIVLETVNLKKYYGVEPNITKALDGINFTVEKGEFVAIVGTSGSGKSTIAKLIASLWDVNSGSIKIGGVDVKQMSFTDFNQKIAYVAQDNYLFNESVREKHQTG